MNCSPDVRLAIGDQERQLELQMTAIAEVNSKVIKTLPKPGNSWLGTAAVAQEHQQSYLN